MKQGTLDRHPFIGCDQRSEEKHQRCPGALWIPYDQCHWASCGQAMNHERHAQPSKRTELRDMLEHAHCCEELLAFADHGDFGGLPIESLGRLWLNIERHDWLLWLMRHLPHRFEANWHDAASALHAVADFACMAGDLRKRYDTSTPELARETCRLIRQYVRLRA